MSISFFAIIERYQGKGIALRGIFVMAYEWHET